MMLYSATRKAYKQRQPRALPSRLARDLEKLTREAWVLVDDPILRIQKLVKILEEEGYDMSPSGTLAFDIYATATGLVILLDDNQYKDTPPFFRELERLLQQAKKS